jgi:hypothetical protein
MEASSGSINEASLFCEGDLPIAQKPSSKKRDQQPMAETIYHAYPRKEDKRAGIKAIVTAMKKHDPAFLLEKTKAYAAAIGWKEKNFIPFPATWFNKERFNDDPETWEQSPKYTSSPNKPKAASVNMGGRKSEYF